MTTPEQRHHQLYGCLAFIAGLLLALCAGVGVLIALVAHG